MDNEFENLSTNNFIDKEFGKSGMNISRRVGTKSIVLLLAITISFAGSVFIFVYFLAHCNSESIDYWNIVQERENCYCGDEMVTFLDLFCHFCVDVGYKSDITVSMSIFCPVFNTYVKLLNSR